MEGISVLARSRSICRRSTRLFSTQNRLNIIFFSLTRSQNNLFSFPFCDFCSRTGSTWFAYTGALLELESKKPPLFNWEMDTCNIAGFDSDGFVKYAQEYFGRHQNGTYIRMENYHDPNPKRNPDRLPSFMKFRCLQTVNPDVRDEGGPLIATLQPHETRVKSPPLSDDHWRQIFEAVPNLAVGVLVRTNSVKRAISLIASEAQREQCGTKKLDGSENCIKDLPKKIQLDIAQLRKSIGDSELKRVIIPNFAARLSSKYGDGKMFCLTYEGLERNIAGEMKAMGKFIGAEVDEASLKRIRKESRSYKRGSNNLAEYIANYDEVRESLSSNKCLLGQLETPLEVSSEAKVLFPSCNFYNASLVPNHLQGMT